jgi:chorismate synthase
VPHGFEIGSGFCGARMTGSAHNPFYMLLLEHYCNVCYTPLIPDLSCFVLQGFEIGSGFSGARMTGSEHNDPFYMDNGKVRTRTNRSGGIQVRAAAKEYFESS